MINSENTQYVTHISKLPQSTSYAIKNHSGAKTCRVAETRAPQLSKKIGEEDHQAPNTEEVEEFGEVGTAGLPDSEISKTSHFQTQMHVDDPVESIADSDLEDGELQKMLTSPLYVQKASGKPDAMVVQEREVSAQYTPAERKACLTSHSSEGQKPLGEQKALFSSELGTQEFCVQKR